MTQSPYISFVACSRNDDHGGNLLHRMQVFVEALAAQCEKHGIPSELVLVEWNPPGDRPGLMESLDWTDSSHCQVRIVQVPPDIHNRFENSDTLPLHQMIAKNAGIRRAKGNFVAATNIDIIFSDPLMAFISKQKLKKNFWFRADRHDVDSEIPAGVPVKRQLSYCRDHILRVHRWNKSNDFKTGRVNMIYRNPAILRLASAFLAFVPNSGNRRDTIRRSLRLHDECGFLDTNASGDFTMMAREHWHGLRGYWEFPGFPIHVDGLLCYAASFSGHTECKLPDDMCIYHIEHGNRSGYSEYESGDFRQRLESKNVPYISEAEYLELVFGMKEGRNPPAFNDDSWGLGDVELPEISP